MTFCKFSPSYQASNKTAVDNVFINEFLPKAPDLAVKAYLLGLSKCNSADETENTMEFFTKTLNICEEDVISLFNRNNLFLKYTAFPVGCQTIRGAKNTPFR